MSPLPSVTLSDIGVLLDLPEPYFPAKPICGPFRSDGPNFCFASSFFRASARSTRSRLPHKRTGWRKSPSTVNDGSLLEGTFWAFVGGGFKGAGIRVNGFGKNWCFGNRKKGPGKWGGGWGE